MKKISIVITIVLAFMLSTHAAYFTKLPYTITQPNGEKIECFVSGDEYFNWIHDEEGYTIIQAPDGYFYYGEESGDIVIPTIYKVNEVNPNKMGIKKWAKISIVKYQKAQSFSALTEISQPISNAPYTGTLNNIVIYIRFSDDDEFTAPRQSFDDKFNAVPGTSVQAYFKEASYNQLTINSTHYPACALNTNLSYQDSHPRNYFRPYNETTNPIGYQNGNNGTERTSREHTLLKDAIEWINANSPIPETLNLDSDNDNFIDNICFNIVGGNDGWASLLWAHSWSLYSYNTYINGKRVYKYTFQPESQVSVKTLCHEMFHAIGAPDLYHYTGNGINPVGNWDLMEYGFGHMGAYMKWKYSQNTWISQIPEITSSGVYTLNPLTSSTNNCYKIPSLNSSSQFYVVEYRRKLAGTFENNIPGSGLLVYRIDPSRNGNANGPPDEVYIYRPNGTTTVNGDHSNAHYSSETGRTAINDLTNPSGFLQNGSPGGLIISNVTSAGSTISFTLDIDFVAPPSSFNAVAINQNQIDLDWQKNMDNNDIILLYSLNNTFGTPVNGTTYSPGTSLSGSDSIIYVGSGSSFSHIGLEAETTYNYKIFSFNGEHDYSNGLNQNATTPCGTISMFPWQEGFENGEMMPNCWEFEAGTQSNGWYIMSGNGGSNPETAHSGYFNACLRDFTTSDDISLLITPTINLSVISNPRLSFWHTQAASASNQDVLKVYYKPTIEARWTELASYTTNIATWTQETIDLPNPSSTYYINFEGNTKAGSGICLDDIEINGNPIVTTMLTNTNEKINDGEIK